MAHEIDHDQALATLNVHLGEIVIACFDKSLAQKRAPVA